MTAIAPSVILPIADAIGGTYFSADDASRAAAVAAILSALPAPTTADLLAFEGKVGPGLPISQAASAPDQVSYSVVTGVMGYLQTAVQANGVGLFSDLKGYADYQNGLTPYTCLYSPKFALLHWLFASTGKRTPSKLLPAASVFAPETGLGTMSVGAGPLTGVAVTSGGTGYASAPAVAFSGGGGTGAAATATVVGGIVTAVTLTSPGTGYTSAPTVAFTGGGGSGAAATATASLIASALTSGILTVSDTSGGVQGYAPATAAKFTATTAINGTLSVIATYDGWDAAGNPFTGHAATVVLDNLALASTVTLTPPSSARIGKITALTVTGAHTATAGAVSISSVVDRVAP